VRRDYVRTFYAQAASARLDELSRAFGAMEAEARHMLARAGVAEPRWEITRAADCRYGRQAYELTVPVAGGPVTSATMAGLAADFHDRHRLTYGHASPGEPVQLVNVRVTAVGRLGGLELARAIEAPGKSSTARSRDVCFRETGLAPCPVHSRDALAAGSAGKGPAIIEATDTTIVVPPGWGWRADPENVMILTRA